MSDDRSHIPALALFDLDETLITGDSDIEWLAFLAEHDFIDAPTHRQLLKRFEEEYAAGTLDLQEFSQTVLAPLSALDMTESAAWLSRFVIERIVPLILPAGRALIATHLRNGDYPVLVTATNRLIAMPVAKRLGIAHVLATPVTFGNNHSIGPLATTGCFRHGKIRHVEALCTSRGATPDTMPLWAERATFYSDSHNDLALLRWVGHPVAVDPDPKLNTEAKRNGWPVISLRKTQATSSTQPGIDPASAVDRDQRST